MSYCSTLKTWQVWNVYRDELDRMRRHQGDHSGIRAAATLLHADAVRVLRERGEHVPDPDPEDEE